MPWVFFLYPGVSYQDSYKFLFFMFWCHLHWFVVKKKSTCSQTNGTCWCASRPSALWQSVTPGTWRCWSKGKLPSILQRLPFGPGPQADAFCKFFQGSHLLMNSPAISSAAAQEECGLTGGRVSASCKGFGSVWTVTLFSGSTEVPCISHTTSPGSMVTVLQEMTSCLPTDWFNTPLVLMPENCSIWPKSSVVLLSMA